MLEELVVFVVVRVREEDATSTAERTIRRARDYEDEDTPNRSGKGLGTAPSLAHRTHAVRALGFMSSFPTCSDAARA